MVNHFATLLTNVRLSVIKASVQNYLLMGYDNHFLQTRDEYFIEISNILGGALITESSPSVFLNKNYTVIELPPALKNVHSILFPEECSDYYKQFFLFSYLKIIDAAGMTPQIMRYDNRITYDLFELSATSDYFKIPKISIPKSSDNKFSLIITGKLKQRLEANLFFDSFLIRQEGSTPSITIFSPVQRRYYKFGEADSRSPANMAITISKSAHDDNMSNHIKIGDTGIGFNIVGPLDLFLSGENKSWLFTAETSMKFDIPGLISRLSNERGIVEDMFKFNSTSSTKTYENLWSSHYNDIYRLSGLLLAYVEKVNDIYGKTN